MERNDNGCTQPIQDDERWHIARSCHQFNDSVAKSKFGDWCGFHESPMGGMKRATDVMVSGNVCSVACYI